jgi:hypothetical protein
MTSNSMCEEECFWNLLHHFHRVKFTEAVVEFIEKKSIDTEHAWNLTSTPGWKFGSNN